MFQRVACSETGAPTRKLNFSEGKQDTVIQLKEIVCFISSSAFQNQFNSSSLWKARSNSTILCIRIKQYWIVACCSTRIDSSKQIPFSKIATLMATGSHTI